MAGWVKICRSGNLNTLLSFKRVRANPSAVDLNVFEEISKVFRFPGNALGWLHFTGFQPSLQNVSRYFCFIKLRQMASPEALGVPRTYVFSRSLFWDLCDLVLECLRESTADIQFSRAGGPTAVSLNRVVSPSGCFGDVNVGTPVWMLP